MATTERDLSDMTDVIEQQQQHHLSVATVSNSAISSKTASVASNADYEKQNYGDADVIESEKSGSDDKKQTSEKVQFRQLFRFATTLDKLYMAVGIFSACVTGAGMPVMSIIFSNILGEFIDFASGKSPSADHLTDEVRKYVLYFLAIGVAVWVFAYLQTVTWMVAGERQAKRVRETYYSAILRQDIAYFDSVGSTGNVLNRISGDISVFQEGISEKVTLLVQYVATFVAGFVVAYTKGWKLSLVLTAVIPLLIVAAAGMAKALASQSSQGQDAYAAAASIAEQALSGIRTVVAFGGQEREIARYIKRLDAAYKVGHKKALAQGFGMASIMLIIFGTYALGFYYGGKLIVDGTMDAGQVLNVFMSIFIGAFSLGNAAPNVSAVSEAMGAAANLFEMIDRVPPIDSESGTGYELRKKDVKGRIEFRHIKFHYPTRPDVPILKDFSLTVEPGETVALVGSSGSGKSTCVGLLERFYDPIEGEVLLDGVNIKDINVKSLRSHVGLVGQEPVLFPTTVLENIKWGGVFSENPPTLDDVKEACRKANAHEFIEDLPETYETDVGEKGSLLSGGQKQRIAIARAIIKNPAILLLDEATSALDTESERLVQEALDAASSGRTTIVIAHRLSTIKNADKIVVMSGGEILEVGRHDELISRQGVYHGLVKAQELKMKKDDDESDSDGADGTRSDEVTVQIDSTARQRPMRRMSTYASVAKSVEEIREEDDERAKDKPMPLLRVLNLNRPELKMVCVAILGAAVNGAIMPMFAYIFSKILDVFSRTDLDYLREGVNFWSGMFGVIGIVAFCANVLQQGLFVLSGERLTRRIRTMTFTALMKQEIGFFDDENNATGVLTSKLAVDASRIEGLAGSLMGSIVQNITSVCVGLTIAFLHGWKLTLVVMAASPAIVLTGILQMKALSGYGGKTRKAYDKSGQIVQQSVSNMRTIISLVREDTFRAMYNEAIRDPHLVAVKGFFISSVGFGASQGLLFFVYALAFWYGGKLVTNYEYSVKDMENVLFAVIFTAISLGQFSTFAPNTAKAKIAAVNIFEILDRRPMIDAYDAEGKERPAPVTGEARVFNGRFAYPARKDVTVLRGLDVDIKPGQTVALVGGSGSGKSTIVSLLLRFYDLLRGTVEVERRSLDRWDVSYLRSNMALVGQEPVLFDLTIAENIAYGKEGASREDVEAAARAANIHNFISNLPKGYDTPVGEKGTQLSGGQKQRIAIARAVIRQPKILLLDEATSALDTESEKVVQDALDKASTGRTTVTIAHRLSTIQNADVIYVIKKGRVAEVGKHMELIAKKGLYHDLVSKQLLNKTS